MKAGDIFMTILTFDQIEISQQKDGTIAGLDLGTKTIGIAISDIGFRFANPRPVLRRRKFAADCASLLKIFQEEKVFLIVVGMPLNMDGTKGPRSQSTLAFVRNMEAHTPIPFIFWDERLSTVAAERHLLEMDVSRQNRAKRIDSAAAAFILQGLLDRIRLSPSLQPDKGS